MTPLPPAFLSQPIAHRGLHDAKVGRPENSLAAIKAAVDHGFGIEIDIGCSRDLHPIVFHDDDLERLTGESGLVNERDWAALSRMSLLGSAQRIPDLTSVLSLIAGQRPLLIEIKDQTGDMGQSDGELEKAVADCLASYTGDVAVMSFNPSVIETFHRLAPAIAIGRITDPFDKQDWPQLSDKRRAELRSFDGINAKTVSFISHNAADLAAQKVQTLRKEGVPVLCWTTKSQNDHRHALQFADNVTFEGYLPSA